MNPREFPSPLFGKQSNRAPSILIQQPGPFLGFVSLILIAGACLLILLTLLGGAVGTNPTNQFFFLEADTSGIPGAAGLTRWTFWNACSVNNGRDACPAVHPAFPLDPPRNFGSEKNVPPQFIG